MKQGPLSVDALIPREMAEKAENTWVLKVQQDLLKTAFLAILAGAFIAFGAVFATLVTTGSDLSYGITKLIGGLAFSLGLILVVIGGAELFTGNNLITMAWGGKKVSFGQMMKNWGIVYAGNMVGARSIVILIFFSSHALFGGAKIGLLVADGIRFLEDALGRYFPDTSLQKCVTHLKRNMLNRVRHGDKGELANELREVFRTSDQLLEAGRADPWNSRVDQQGEMLSCEPCCDLGNGPAGIFRLKRKMDQCSPRI